MNQRPLAHTSLPNTATGDKLPNPPIPSRFYYTPWACKEQLEGEKGGWEQTARSGCEVKKKRLIDRDTMTVGRYKGQTKAGIGNHLQYHEDMCSVSFLMLKKGALLHNYVWQNPSWERSTDRCQCLKVHHLRKIANILRMDQSERLILQSLWCYMEFMWVSWIFSTDECDSTTEHDHLRHHFSWAEKQLQGTMTSVLKPSQRNACRHSHWHTHTLLWKQQECERASGLKGYRKAHTHTHTSEKK